MKNITLILLRAYQIIVSPLFHQLLGVGHACRYLPTCSEYARIHIKQEGLLVGGVKSFLRLLFCQPFVTKLPVMLQK